MNIMTIHTKICGIKTPEALNACVKVGVRFVGFVFYPHSPRYVNIGTARELALMLPTGVRSVALFVDPTNEQLEQVLGHVQVDMIQLHGGESPSRLSEIKARYAIPIIKAFPVREAIDIDKCSAYKDADWYLFDTKPIDSNIKGGSGQSFDWSLLNEREFDKKWFLSGGLTTNNVSRALSMLSPDALDVSSGVESIRGVKDLDKIRAFINCVNGV